MYVRDRSADSICDTELAFLAINAPYLFSNLDNLEGVWRASGRRAEASLGRAIKLFLTGVDLGALGASREVDGVANLVGIKSTADYDLAASGKSLLLQPRARSQDCIAGKVG